MLTTLEHVQIPVRRMDRAIDWYVERLGFRLQGRDGDRIAFLTLPEGPMLKLWRTGDDTAANFTVDGEPFPVLLFRTDRASRLSRRPRPEIRKGRTRRLVGLETEIVDQKVMKPEAVIPRFWQNVMPRLREIRNPKLPFATIGLYLYEPPFGPGQDFRYFAGIEIDPDSDAPLPDGMTERTIPADDTFAVTYRGTAEGFGRVWDYFHGFWFPRQSAYDAIPDYEFERHDDRFLGTHHEASVFELHFPIRPRAQDKRLTEKIVVDEKGGHVLQDLRGESVRMVSFQGASLHGVDLREATLRHVNLVGSRLEHIYFADVRIDEIQMGGTVFEHIRRPDAGESRLEAEPGTDGWVNVEPVVFRDSDLSEARFENCDLRDVSLTGCRIEGMRIDGIPVAELLAAYRETKQR